MYSVKMFLVAMVGLAVSVSVVTPPGARAQAPAHPLDEQLANTPAPWTVPGKWGPRGNWGRWGEQDKRGMLNFITPEMIVKAAGLVKQGKVYPLGEEMHGDLPRVITPSRFGVQVIIDNDGYDRVTQPGQFDPKRSQGASSYHRSCTTTSAPTSTRSRTSTGRTRCSTTCLRPSRSGPCTATRRA